LMKKRENAIFSERILVIDIQMNHMSISLFMEILKNVERYQISHKR
jgi:hypothetical protein